MPDTSTVSLIEELGAEDYAEVGESLYEVEPLGYVVELDMLWITWVRESLEARNMNRVLRQAMHYWQGDSTKDHLSGAQPHWEFLAPDGWRVLQRL